MVGDAVIESATAVDPRALMIALVVTRLAIVGKLISGIAAGSVN